MKVMYAASILAMVISFQTLRADTVKLEDLTERDREILSKIRDEKVKQKVLEDLAKLKAQNAERQKRSQERALRSEMTVAVTAWIQSRSEADAEACDNAIDRLIAAQPAEVRSYFCAAQFAFIRGAYDKAIAILEEGAAKDPEALSPVANLPVKTVCHLWIATVQRYSGDVRASNATYVPLRESVDPNDLSGGVVTAICCLYLAENGGTDRAQMLNRLESIEKLRVRHVGASHDPVAFYRQWASYLRARQTGQERAAAELPVAEGPVFFIAIGHLRACGLLPDDVALTSQQCRIIQDALFGLVHDSHASAMDKESFRVVLGYREYSEQHYDDAVPHFAAVLDGDSFLSPFAGLWLAESNKKQGRHTEAEAVLRRIETRYLGYRPLVEQKRAEWKR